MSCTLYIKFFLCSIDFKIILRYYLCTNFQVAKGLELLPKKKKKKKKKELITEMLACPIIKCASNMYFCSIMHSSVMEYYLAIWMVECLRENCFLFNDALNTFYLWLYGVRHMVKDHSDSEKGNPLPPHRLLLSINSKGSFICTIPQTG